MDYQADIHSDTPISSPADDAFGFSGFAKNLARAIRRTPSPSGLVLAINGPWGAGKSSLLNLITHDLKNVYESECPTIIEFNPWWFNGRDQLASQLLSQLSTRIRNEAPSLLKIGELMAEYSGALSKAVALYTGVPWVDKPVGLALKLLKRKPREVPQLKSKIAELLRGTNHRILFIIDDLDRLTPDEIRELFKVIKALADFPNVIYLLSFDRKVVVDALSKSLGVDGGAYLEKIVQATFSLPAVGKPQLQKKLFSELDALLSALPMANFDSTYWGNVYFSGLSSFIAKPRDIVRVMNTLTATYPAVAGEVNPVDFIALEFLRIFQPKAYEVVRDNRDMFTGLLSEIAYQRNDTKDFHEAWLGEIEEKVRPAIRSLMIRLFPKVEAAIGNMNYGGEARQVWRKELRVCSPGLFDLFFGFSVPDGYLSRAELSRLLDLTADLPVFVASLKSATNTTLPDGHSKARDIVDGLTNLQDGAITDVIAARLLRALFAMDQDLLTPADERGGMTSLPNSWRISFLIDHLLEIVPTAKRVDLLVKCIEGSKAYSTMASVVFRLGAANEDPKRHRPWMDGIDQAAVDVLKAAVLVEMEKVVPQDLLGAADMPNILNVWATLGSPDTVKEKLTVLLDDDGQVIQILERFLTVGSSYTYGDQVSRTTYLLDPRWLERFFELKNLEDRVQRLVHDVPEGSLSKKAVERFLHGMSLLREGKQPDSDD